MASLRTRAAVALAAALAPAALLSSPAAADPDFRQPTALWVTPALTLFSCDTCAPTVGPAPPPTSLPTLTVGRVSARLTGARAVQTIGGATITFSTRGQVLCSAVSNSVGIAACYPDALGLLAVIQNGSVTATYAGSVTYQPSAGSANLL